MAIQQDYSTNFMHKLLKRKNKKYNMVKINIIIWFFSVQFNDFYNILTAYCYCIFKFLYPII